MYFVKFEIMFRERTEYFRTLDTRNEYIKGIERLGYRLVAFGKGEWK